MLILKSLEKCDGLVSAEVVADGPSCLFLDLATGTTQDQNPTKISETHSSPDRADRMRAAALNLPLLPG